jgi:alanyl-tRNA synthetase
MPDERPAVVAVGGVVKGRPQIVVATNDEARRWGLAAGDLVRTGAGVLGGNGGGKPDVAQGGGSDPEKIGEALLRIEHTIGERVTAGR